MGDLVDRVAAVAQEAVQRVVADRLGSGIDGEHSADVGMDRESGERAQEEIAVVRRGGRSTLGVGHSDDAIDVREGIGRTGEATGEGAGEARRERRRAQDHDCVARADTAGRAAAEPGEGARAMVFRDLEARTEGRPFQPERAM